MENWFSRLMFREGRKIREKFKWKSNHNSLEFQFAQTKIQRASNDRNEYFINQFIKHNDVAYQKGWEVFALAIWRIELCLEWGRETEKECATEWKNQWDMCEAKTSPTTYAREAFLFITNEIYFGKSINSLSFLFPWQGLSALGLWDVKEHFPGLKSALNVQRPKEEEKKTLRSEKKNFLMCIRKQTDHEKKYYIESLLFACRSVGGNFCFRSSRAIKRNVCCLIKMGLGVGRAEMFGANKLFIMSSVAS